MRRAFLLPFSPVVEGASGPCVDGHPIRERYLARITHLLVVVLLLLARLGVPIQVTAQSVTNLKGVVYDRDDGQPVTLALVSLSRTAYATHTRDDGRFSFEHIPEGSYTVVVRADGYDSSVTEDVRLVTDVSRHLVISLSKRVYEIPGTVVEGKAVGFRADKVTVIGRQQIEMDSPADLAELLTSIPGVHVQRTGGAASRARVSIRGCAPRQVLILLDGHRINSSATGEADLGSIPVQMVDQIEIHKGGTSAEFGPDALGGVINIITQPRFPTPDRSFEIKHSEGKWGAGMYALSLLNPLAVESLSVNFNYGKHTSDGNYPFHYTVQPSNRVYDGVRINNDVTASNYHIAGQYRPSAKTALKFSSQAYSSKRGLPDRASRQNEQARTEDNRILISSTWEQSFSERFQSELHLSFSRFTQSFVDTLNLVSRNQFCSEYTNDITIVRIGGRLHPWVGHSLNVGSHLQNEWLDHEDRLRPKVSMGRTSRTNLGLFMSVLQQVFLPRWALFDRFTVEGAVRWDRVATDNDSTSISDPAHGFTTEFWSPKIGANLAWGDRISLILRGSYGKSLSLPTLNALFWKGDARSTGNPSLKPEKAEHSEGGVELTVTHGKVTLNAGITYFHTFYYDLVKWRPDFRGVWKPFNLAGARITGHEDIVVAGLFDKMLELVYQNTVTAALNREPGLNSYGKQLTFTPHYQTSLTARVNHQWLHASYAIRWVDRRFAKENNQKWYAAYRLDDLCLRGTVPYGQWQLQVEYKAYNVRDEDYTLITHYPMPPREWQIGASLSYSFGRGTDKISWK